MKKRLILSVAVVLLVVMVACMCVACTPSEDSITKRFEKEGYRADVVSVNGTTVAKYTKLEDIVGCTVTWYENKEDAEEAYNSSVELLGEDGVVKKGNAVAVGSEAGLEIFSKLV